MHLSVNPFFVEPQPSFSESDFSTFSSISFRCEMWIKCNLAWYIRFFKTPVSVKFVGTPSIVYILLIFRRGTLTPPTPGLLSHSWIIKYPSWISPDRHLTLVSRINYYTGGGKRRGWVTEIWNKWICRLGGERGGIN